MSFSVSGKTAIVTGAGDGIGLAVARHLADKGANVMCVDAQEKKLINEFGNTEAEEDSNLRIFAGDLRQRLTLANLVSATIDAFDQIDILVNAARYVTTTNALDTEDDTVEELLQTNLMTSLRLSQQVARRMIKQSESQPEGQVGSIINFSSIAAKQTHQDLMGYSIASAAVQQMTRSMALVLAPHRIRVNALSFGSVMSSSLRTALADNSDWRNEICGHTPLGRVASPTELCDMVQFLAAESASFMTGEVMVVDGGRSLLDPVSLPAH